MSSATVLVVDDEAGIREFLEDALASAGYRVVQAENGHEAAKHLRHQPIDLMFLDMRMPGEFSGMDVLRVARAESRLTQVIVLTAHGTIDTAVEAMRLGAFDFLEKPLASPDQLYALANRALHWRGRASDRAPEPLHHDPTQPPVTNRRSKLNALLWQLRRRHVYRVVAAYGAVGFFVLQTAELVLPGLPSPQWLYPLITGLVLAGLPIAVVLGWIYDITESGITRTSGTRRRLPIQVPAPQ